MIKATLSYYFPNRLGRIVLLALEDVIGKSDLNALLHQSSKRYFNQHSGQQVTLEETEQGFIWCIERCPWCWGRTTFDLVGHFAVGMLRELLYWVSGGKYYNVVEQTCIAQ